MKNRKSSKKKLLLFSIISFAIVVYGCTACADNHSTFADTSAEAISETETILETQEDPEIKDTSDEIQLPDLPDDFIEFQKFVGQEISIFDVDTSHWDLKQFSIPIGNASLYGNTGKVAITLGWDDKTITNIQLLLDNGEYIQGDEYKDICKKLEDIFGEPTAVADGITDFNSNKNCAFRLLRNAAGIGWVGEEKENFDNSKPTSKTENTAAPEEPKKAPAIGMTPDEVKNSTWGEPSTINKTTTKYGVSEQWVYRSVTKDKYIYFDDGIVSAIQE